jgi:hypothetical protein
VCGDREREGCSVLAATLFFSSRYPLHTIRPTFALANASAKGVGGVWNEEGRRARRLMWDSIVGVREEWGYRRLASSTTTQAMKGKGERTRKTDMLDTIAVWVQVVGGMPLLGWRFPWIGLNVAQGTFLSFIPHWFHVLGTNSNPFFSRTYSSLPRHHPRLRHLPSTTHR